MPERLHAGRTVAGRPIPGLSVAIVGGGPAGLIAAERLAAGGVAVTVYDRMASVGRKFLLAGRGGLNLTHSEGIEALLDRYGPGRAALEPAVRGFSPDALRAWCEGLGEPVFVGSSGRVFPTSWKASPLLRAWLRRLSGLGVRFCTGHRWVGWDEGALAFETASGPVRVRPSATLLALGGATWPRMGSDGAWVPVLAAHGVSVAPLSPANAGVLVGWSDAFRARFAGSPLKRIAAEIGGQRVRGEAVITADGLEGGVVYALQRAIRTALAHEGRAVMTFDLRPDLDAAALQRRLGGPGVSRSNAWRRAGLAPASAGLLREVDGVPKRAVVVATGLAPIDRAISTAGGVRFCDLNAGFMVRSLPGVFAAGEMLDWDAPTGGYLLQASFSTGSAAAAGMLAWMAA